MEALHERREAQRGAARERFAPLRLTLTVLKQPFLSGHEAGYADFMVAGALLWAASVATMPLLEANDPVVGWFERVRDLCGGAGRTSPTHDIVQRE
nr:glutathione binding-like protein [Chondromyces crocatus]